MSINDTSENLTPKSNAYITQVKLDIDSSYTHVYICSVIHQNPTELRRCLQLQFSKLNSLSNDRVTTNLQLFQDKEAFEHQIQELDLSETKDPELPLLVPYDATEQKRKKIVFNRRISINYRLFIYSVFITIFSLLIQLLFIGALIKEYILFPIIITNDRELIFLRIISFVIVGFIMYIEFKYGRMKFNHALRQGFLYQNSTRRIISGFFGLMQMIEAILCFSCTTLLITQSQTVRDNIECLSAMLVLSGLDNWVGEYFFFSNEKIQTYTRGVITQIWIGLKGVKEYHYWLDVLENIIYSVIAIFLGYWLYNSINFDQFKLFV